MQPPRQEEREHKHQFHLADLDGTADNKEIFSKGDSTNWSYKLYTVTKVVPDSNPSYKIDYSPKRYNENLLGSTNLGINDNNQIMRELKRIQ